MKTHTTSMSSNLVGLCQNREIHDEAVHAFWSIYSLLTDGKIAQVKTGFAAHPQHELTKGVC